MSRTQVKRLQWRRLGFQQPTSCPQRSKATIGIVRLYQIAHWVTVDSSSTRRMALQDRKRAGSVGGLETKRRLRGWQGFWWWIGASADLRQGGHWSVVQTSNPKLRVSFDFISSSWKARVIKPLVWGRYSVESLSYMQLLEPGSLRQGSNHSK